ncbi:hypothetical protein KCP77_22140 [Salmonella enterica subsp. enterica]|nr:hypothetical protein KCP77_22140 [Salmonella enterica subsp. enterica]
MRDGCLNGEFAALITGPRAQSTLLTTQAFVYHRILSFSEERSQAKKSRCWRRTSRAALATTHLPRYGRDCKTPSPLRGNEA